MKLTAILKIENLIQKTRDSKMNIREKEKFLAVLEELKMDIAQLTDRTEYVAVKIWTVEDVESCLVEKGYLPSPKNVAAVVDSGLLSGLSDCLDCEWECIESAISSVSPNLDMISGNDYFEIFQLELNDETKKLAFKSYDAAISFGNKIKLSNYRRVYTKVCEPEVLLENIYMEFNMNIPEDFTGRSLSVSDVIALHQGEQVYYFYVDLIGFRQLNQNDFLK